MKKITFINRLIVILIIGSLSSCTRYEAVKNQPEFNIFIPKKINPVTCEPSAYGVFEGINKSSTKINYNQHSYYLFPFSEFDPYRSSFRYYLGVDSQGDVAERIFAETNPTIFRKDTILLSGKTCIKNVKVITTAQIKNEQENQLRLQQQEFEKRKFAMQYVKIGTKICHDEINIYPFLTTFIGFVENRTDEKIQIRVIGCVNKNRTIPCNAKEQITWDFYENWRICE